jgi:hypothetical protein
MILVLGELVVVIAISINGLTHCTRSSFDVMAYPLEEGDNVMG